MIFAKKVLAAVALILASAFSAHAQGTVSGQEVLVPVSGTTISITPPNTSALNFVTLTGTNTFILPLTNPTVSVRIYLTNNTANACPSGFTAQMWAATDAQTSSFNNSLQNWQVIPIQTSAGSLVQAVLPNIPANGSVYFSSTAVSAPRLALQLINTVAGGCSTTNVEVSAVISTVSVTSPLISADSPTTFNGTSANQVQGIVAQTQNGAPVNPLMAGGVELAINGNLLTAGIDNWNSNFLGLPGGASGLFTVNTVPAPAKSNELAISINAGTSDNVNANITAPWTCVTGNSCQNAGGALSASFTKNPKLGTTFNKTYTNVTSTGQDLDAIVLFSSPTATVRQGVVVASTSNTATLLSGSAIVVAAVCALTSCPALTTPTDTQGNVYTLLTFQNFTNGLRTSSLWVWASTTLSTVGANTVTFGGGTINTTEQIEVTGVATASLTTPAITFQTDVTGVQVVRQDAQFPNLFSCNVTLSTNTTTQCQIAPTVIGAGGLSVPVRLYVTDFQINTTTAGTATTIQLKTGTGANCGTGTANLSAIQYPNTTVGIQSIIGPRTPLLAPLQNAVCVTQAGTTAGTSVVEIRGFLAP